VEDLKQTLKGTKKQLEAVAHQRDKALQRAKEARSQEDEYFEENSQLQQQDEALNNKLTETSGILNRSRDDNSMLKEKVEDLKAEGSREKANSHAAGGKNQAELMEARNDLKVSLGVNRNLQAELQRMQAVLPDEERHKLGLPPLKKDGKAAPVTPPAPPVETAPAPPVETASAPPVVTAPAAEASTPAAKPVASAVVPLAETHETGRAEQGVRPQVSEVKHWEKAAVATKPSAKRLLARATPAPATAKEATSKPVVKTAPVAVVKALPAKSAEKVKTAAALPGEPLKPVDDAAAMLASVTEPKPAPSSGKKSALQKLADFFASPLQR
jgi:hypothetical protein